MNKKALLLGSYGQDNLGDDILMCNYVRMLKECGYSEIFANASVAENVPQEVAKDVTLRETYGTSIAEWLKVLARVDVIAYGGGTIFKELYQTTSRKKYAVIARILAFNTVARLFGKRIVNLNIGIGELHSRLGHFITRTSLRLSNYTIFRDEVSYDLARDKYRLKAETIELGTDGIFIDQRWHTGREKGKKAFPFRGAKVGVNVLHDIPEWIDSEKYVKEIIGACNKILSSGHRIVFLPFQSKFNAHNDKVFIEREIIPYLVNGDHEMLISRVDNACENMLSVDMMIGMRFHSLLLALSTSTPFLAIEYDIKCTNFMREYPELPSLALSRLSSEDLMEKIVGIMDNWESCREKVSSIGSRLYETNNRCKTILTNK